MSDDCENSVLLSTFHSGRKKLRVFFHRGVIVWDSEKPPFGKYNSSLYHELEFSVVAAQQSLPIENVLAVRQVQRRSNVPGEVRLDPNHFVVHYAERGRQKTWKYSQLTLKHSDPMQVSSWVKTLQNNLQST